MNQQVHAQVPSVCVCVCVCKCARVFKCGAIIEMEIKVVNLRAMKKEKTAESLFQYDSLNDKWFSVLYNHFLIRFLFLKLHHQKR